MKTYTFLVKQFLQKGILRIFFSMVSLIILTNINAQVTLSPGDIMVVGFRSDATDNFAVVPFVNLTAGTKIHFTDKGWSISGGGFTTSNLSETQNTYTVPAGGILAGTVLTAADMGISISLDEGQGDQVFIYQTADGNATSTPTLIYAFNNQKTFSNDANGWQSGTTSSNVNSDPPSGLTVVTSDGGTGTAFGRMTNGLSTEHDDLYYSGPTSSAAAADWITRIHTPSNWTGDNGSFDSNHPDLDVELPSFFSIAAANTAPSIAVDNLDYTEGQNSGNPVQIDGTATANDTEDNWDGGSLTVQITANNEAGDEISVQDVGNITVNTGNGQIGSSGTNFATATVNSATVTNGSTLTINFNSNATDTRIQELVRAISYRSTSSTPSESARTVTFVLSDDTAGTNETATINVTGVNTITIAATTSAVSEGGVTNLVFRFTRESTSGSLAINFSVGGTAQDSDYLVSSPATFNYNQGTNSGSVTFADGDATVEITVNPTDDSTIEADEIVVVNIETP